MVNGIYDKYSNNGVKSLNIHDISENNRQHIAIILKYSDISANKILKAYFNGSLIKIIIVQIHHLLMIQEFIKYKLGTNRSEQHFKGYLTSLVIYDSILSDDDILELYNYDTDPSEAYIKTVVIVLHQYLPLNIFFTVYLSNNKVILDSSENALDVLDASYNFIMNANSASAIFQKIFKV